MKFSLAAAVLCGMTSAVSLPEASSSVWPAGYAPLNITMLPRGGEGTLVRRDGALEKRVPGGVYICQDINWQNCGFAQQPLDTCIRLDSPWWKTISSIGPDTYNAILAFDDYNCQSQTKTAFFNPGSGDLRNQGWNDRIGSFRVIDIGGERCINFNSPGHGLVVGNVVECPRCCNHCARSGRSCCPEGQNC